MSAAMAFEVAAVASTSAGFVFALRQHDWSRRLRMAICDAVMIAAMLDSGALGHRVVPPILWVLVLIVVTLANALIGTAVDRARRGGLLVSVAMIVMAGLIGHSIGPMVSASGSHAAHGATFGTALTVATIAYVVVAAVAAVRQPRGSGRGHAIATVGSVAFMAIGCVV